MRMKGVMMGGIGRGFCAAAIFLLPALLVAGCTGSAGIDREAPLKLAPMPRPDLSTRVTERHFLDKGRPVTTRILKRQGGLMERAVTAGYPKGCTWTDDGWFSPSIEWSGCGGSPGTQVFTKTGDIWPLEVGNTESYEVTRRIESSQRTYTHRCEVTGTAMVTLKDERFPTYEVVCSGNQLTQTWYISPDVGEAIRFTKVHSRDGILEDIEAVF